MSTNAAQDAALLREVKRRRTELRTSMDVLERALASPASAATSASWNARLRVALVGLYDDVARHIVLTEGSGGLYAELATHSPRLARAIERLTAEHGLITRRIEELLTWSDVADPTPEVPETRRAGTELLVVLMHHRQRGADVLFEAYEVDIGGET